MAKTYKHATKYSVTYFEPVTQRWWTRVFVGLKRTIAFVVAMRGRGFETHWGKCAWPPCEQSTDVEAAIAQAKGESKP